MSILLYSKKSLQQSLEIVSQNLIIIDILNISIVFQGGDLHLQHSKPFKPGISKLLPLKFMALIIPALIISSCSDPEAITGNPLHSVKTIPGTASSILPVRWEIGKYGGIWRDTYSEDPKSYNPFSNLDGTHSIVTGLILDYLFDYDPYSREWKGNIIEDYSVEFDETKDTMELLCTLRSNIFWSDGIQMTSDDVLWWFENIDGDAEIDPIGASGQFITMPDGSREKYRMEKTGKLSFKYIFPRIIGNPLLVVNTGSVIPKHIWEPVLAKGKDAVKAFWGITTKPEDLVGNGPFLLEENKPGERLVFKRNPNYWMTDARGNKLPYIDRMILSQIPDSNAELLKFQKGETEAYPMRGQDMATLLPESEKGDFTIWNGGPSSGYPALIFNHKKEALSPGRYALFTNPSFKKGISCLIDRETIINQTINGLAEPLYHIISETNKYYNPEFASRYSYNPAEAARLFEEAGLREKNREGYFLDSEGNTVAFDILTSSSDPILHDYLNIIITDMKKAGIKANLTVADFNVIVQKLLYTGEWDCYLASFSFPTFPEQWNNLWLSSGNLHYWNPSQETPALEWEKKIDKLYNALIYTFRDDKIREYYDDFQKTLIDEMVIIPIFRKYTFSAFRNKWGNINWGFGYSAGDGYRRIYLKEEE